jgi:hypothetical protein
VEIPREYGIELRTGPVDVGLEHRKQGQIHGQEYTEKAWYRTDTGARETHLVDDILESALGRDPKYCKL